MAACPAFFNIDVWERSYHLPEVPSSYLPSLISITTRLTFQNRVLLREEVMEPLLPQHLPISAGGVFTLIIHLNPPASMCYDSLETIGGNTFYKYVLANI